MKPLADQFVLVLGMGESGLAMAQWCAREGARLRVADSRAEPPALAALKRTVPTAEVALGPFSDALLEGVDAIALSPGIDVRIALLEAARRRGLPIVGEMSLFADALERLHARAGTRILAITGTNGKTTTTALTAAMCRAAGLDAVEAGNISPSALAVLMDRLDRGIALPQCWVLELSSFQLETTAGLAAEAATVLNVSDDHLDRYADVEAYAAAKARIFAGGGVQILNRQDACVMAMGEEGRTVVTFGTDAPPKPCDFGLVTDDGLWLARGQERLLRSDALRLAGLHNLANALAALALGAAAGCELAPMLHALRSFAGLPHRMQLVALRADGAAFYNDSKGTNVGATVAALEGLDRPVVLIAGGDGKGQDFAPLRAPIVRHARAVVLIGRDGPAIEAALQDSGIALERAPDMEAAVARAHALAKADDIVLLSPACSSLDMFRNYPHRAEMFIEAVLGLPGVRAA